MAVPGEIVVLPFHSSGHTFPATELCRHLASRGQPVTLFLPPSPSTLHHPLIKVIDFSSPPPPPPPTSATSHQQFPPPPPQLYSDPSLEDYLSSSPPVAVAIVDVMMSHCVELFKQRGVPVVSFFTSSACSASIEHAAHKLSFSDMNPGDIVPIPGLPEDLALTAFDLTRRDTPPPPGGPGHPPPPFGPDHRGPCSRPSLPFGPGHCGLGGPPPFLSHSHPLSIVGPPSPLPQTRDASGPESRRREDDPASEAEEGPITGRPPRGITEMDGAIALIFNTCDDLEGPFLEYVSRETQKPAWGVGPLLPPQFWSTSGSLIHDEEARPNQEPAVTSDEVRRWLDSKPDDSVLYISFGTLVGHSAVEHAELAAALVESDTAFIWVLQAGGHATPSAVSSDRRDPEELVSGAGDRGMVVRGWAPQLLVLSHPATGGFLTHCGWNSTVEALACGVPLLTWPVKGDQFHNEKLVVNRLKVGRAVVGAGGGPGAEVTRGELKVGIEELMGDAGMKARARSIRSIFAGGFPASSSASLDDLIRVLKQH